MNSFQNQVYPDWVRPRFLRAVCCGAAPPGDVKCQQHAGSHWIWPGTNLGHSDSRSHHGRPLQLHLPVSV